MSTTNARLIERQTCKERAVEDVLQTLAPPALAGDENGLVCLGFHCTLLSVKVRPNLSVQPIIIHQKARKVNKA